MLGVPHGPKVGLDRELEIQRSRAGGEVPDDVLDDHALTAVGADLEPLDLQAVEHRSVAKPVAVRVVDELDRGSESRRLSAGRIRERGPEAIDQLDGVQPQPAHLSGHVPAQVWEVPVLCADQVGPVTGGDVGAVRHPAMIAQAGQNRPAGVGLG
jgi:hypothetical protein